MTTTITEPADTMLAVARLTVEDFTMPAVAAVVTAVIDELALPQDRSPAVFGYAYQPHRPRYRRNRTLHRASTWLAAPEGMSLACPTGGGLRIAQPEVVLPSTDEFGWCGDESLVLLALATRGIPPARLCKRCFRTVADAYSALYAASRSEPLLLGMLAWDYRTAQTRREVTVSADAAALIADAVAYTTGRAAGADTSTVEVSGEPVTVTLSGHADAVIAGLVGPADTGNSTVVDDRKRVWKQGIYASDATWDEVHAAFPLSLYHGRDLSGVDRAAVWAEIREAFPLSVFRQWADASLMFQEERYGPLWDQLTHYYDPEAGL